MVGNMRVIDVVMFRSLIIVLSLSILLVSCSASGRNACPVTEPVWIKPPEDSAVSGTPEDGYYFVNTDRSIWASAWWTPQDENYLRANGDGIKVGWFRPAGAVLEITGQRIDGKSTPLEVNIPCCYPTRFQSSGLYFPADGCWEVTAKAADSELTFTIWVEP